MPMKSTDILWASGQRQAKQGMTQGKYFGGLQELMRRTKGKLLQIGNTVFMLTFPQKGVIEFHMASQEPIQQIVQNLRIGAQQMKKMGAKKVYTVTQDAGYARVARMTGLPVKVARDQRGYRIELDL